ncbi:hypothetical protein BGY98DRAFT_715860 [Russula aff. rugulosa BPL654]|nr:hypothetical protein BGY98DRAFT_715860 [Russula aff. rugulosa BPL654]
MDLDWCVQYLLKILVPKKTLSRLDEENNLDALSYVSTKRQKTSCFPADPSTHVSMSGYCQTSWLLFSLDRVISDHLPSVSSRRLQPLYILSRSAAIDITSILLTAVLSDQRGVPIILHAILSRTRGWCYCWNATRVRTFQTLDSGSKLKILKCSLQVSRSLMPGP